MRAPRPGPLALAAISGALGGLFWLPTGLAPLLPLSFIPVLIALRRADTQAGALRVGLVYGAARYAVAAHFLLALLEYSPLAITFYLLAIAYILPFALLESWGAFWLESRTGLPRGIGFAVLFAFGEKIRTLGDLSFPADLLSNGLGATPSWTAWTGLTGPFAATLWVILVAVLIEAAMHSWPRARSVASISLVAAALLWFVPPLAGTLVTPEEALAGPSIRVAVVQPCHEVRDQADPGSWPRLWQRLKRLTASAAANVDLVVWPESARPSAAFWKQGSPPVDREVSDLARVVETPILYGSELYAYEANAQGRPVGGPLYNGAALVTPDEGLVDWYGKQRLLPFAEGMPFGRYFGWDPAKRRRNERRPLLTMLGNFTPGPEPRTLEVGPARLGILICYEGLYPELARAYRQKGANALVVLTNDAWWGRSAFPLWHAQMVSARARELGVPVLRAANSGVSSLTDARGRLVAKTEVDEVTVLTADLRPAQTPPTLYARTGDLVSPALVVLIAGAGVVGLLRGVRARRRRTREEDGVSLLARQPH